MAAPTITLLGAGGLTDGALTTADANTGWNDLTTADTDIKVEGTGSMSGIFRADGEQGYYDSGTAPVTAVGKTVRGWILSNSIAYMGTHAGDPYKLIAYDGTTTESKAIFGSDTYPGGWFNYIWDMDEFTTLTLANVQRWGVEAGHATNAKNVTNTWMDAIRYLDGFSMTGGTSPDKVRLSDIATYDKGTTTLRGYGIVTEVSSVYFCTGTLQFGTGATTHYFEMDGDILVFKDEHIAAGLYSLSGVGSGTDVVIKNSLIRSAGTTDATRFVFDWDEANLSSCVITDNLIVRGAAINFKSGQTVTGNTFDDCGQITHGGADMDGGTIKGYEGTAGTAALVYNVNADPDGETDAMTFTKGTAATHAIELGTNTPSTITLRDWTTSGYNAANGNNDSTIYNNSGKAITINIIGGVGNFTYRNGTSASTTISIDPVDTTLTVKDINTLANIENARVLMIASDGTGALPYQESVTITRSVSTATVAHTGHGMATGDFAFIEGANQDEYNGCFEITVTGVDAYTYTVPGTPTTPATGTILSTGGIFNTLTNSSGVVTDSRSITADQPIAGRIRLATGSTLYKSTPFAGTIDKDNGITGIVYLIPDT